MRKLLTLIVAVAAPLIATTVQGNAQATRTWVSGVGDDANPCSRTAPCKTFAGAISKTAAGGEISVLDPGGFGAVTITKSISIIAKGAEGSIIGALVSGIVINAAATDEVTLHGLTIEGVGNGLNGIRIIRARAVHISDCLIRGFQGASAGRGIAVDPVAPVRVTVTNSQIVKNQQGVLADPQTGGRPTVVLTRVAISDNSLHGIRARGQNSTVFLNDTVITGNNVGISIGGAAQVISFGNNVIADNNTNGAPTQVVPPQ